MSNEPTVQPAATPDAQDKPLAVERAERPDRSKAAIGPLSGLLFALIGGALAWALIQAYWPIATLPDELFNSFGMPKAEMVEEFEAAERSVGLRNRLFACGLLGAMLGAALGVGQGVARRCLKTLLLAAMFGGLVSLLFGCVAGLGGHFALLNRLPLEERLSLQSVVIIECVLWGIIGGGLGLTLGALTQRVNTAASCLVGGIAAGVLGGIFFPVAAGLLTPSEPLHGLVPASGTARLLWIGIPAALVGLIVPFAANQKSRTKKDQKPASD